MSTIVLNKKPTVRQEKIAAKGIKPPKAIEWEARRAINRALEEFYAELDYFKEHVEGYTPAQASRILSELQEKWAVRLTPQADIISANWLKAIDDRQKKKTMEMLRGALGVDIQTIFEDPIVQQGLDNMRLEAAYLIKTIPYDSIGKVAERVFQYYRGEPMPEGRTLTQQLKEEFNITYERAKRIARDQTNKMNGNLTQIRQTGLGIEEYIWRTARDQRVVGNPSGFYPKGNRVHGNHWEREGKVFRWDTPPKDGVPGSAINCVLGNIKIDLTYGLRHIYGRFICADIYKIEFENGDFIECTENHPFYNGNGFIPAKELKVGDFCYKDETIKPEQQIEIGKLFYLFAHKTRLVPAQYAWFHGDYSSEPAEVIDIDLEEQDERIKRSYQKVKIIRIIKQKNRECTVYNLETKRGVFNANGYLNHNCRCFAEPIIDIKKLKVHYY